MENNNSNNESYPTCESCKKKVSVVYQNNNCKACLTQEFSDLSKRLENSRIISYLDIDKHKIAVTASNLEEICELIPG
jgi:hypothetical protein